MLRAPASSFIALLNGGVDTGWTFTTPLSTHYLNTHVITAAMGVFIAGFSSIFTGLNFIVTIHRMRCPGMTWFRLPLFCWSNYAASILMVLGTPVLGHHAGSGHAGADRSASAFSTPPRVGTRCCFNISSGSILTRLCTS